METSARNDLLAVETPESVALSYELADVGSRGLAVMLDTLILTLLLSAESLIATIVTTVIIPALGGGADRAMPWVVGVTIVVVVLTSWGYFVIGEAAANGRTPGKRALGLRVVRDDGGRISALDAVIRNALRLIDILPGTYGVGIGSMLLTKKRKRLGDMVAGTVVVRERAEIALDFVGGRREDLDELARDFLRRRAAFSDAARYQVACEILAAYGEHPGQWDEATIAGRLADLSDSRG